ncbi:helix-turn-helix domain-containing protein [Micromonospora echinaurantiaca]|uniref:helix-turn-helix domain-containing protein n=1 Tax=Micromonospora echinaurantiaca TaxID=47857 RepID=UPI003441D5A7
MDAEGAGAARSWVEFGRELRWWRRAAGLTQSQLGQRVGYHHSVISRVESGLREAPAGLARRLDDVLATNGALAALGAGRGPRDAAAPTGDPTLFAAPGVLTADGVTPPGVPVWPTRLPYAGIACPLHGDAGCAVPAPGDVLTTIARLVRRGSAERPTEPVTDLVHGLAALLPGYTQATMEQVSTDIVGSIERILHLVTSWAEAVHAAGRPPQSLLRLAAGYAQLAGRLRMQRGQSAVGMAWFGHGLRWAGVSADPVAQATLYSDFCTLTRLDRDGASSLRYARALGAVDPRRGWVGTVAHLYQARAYGLMGDAAQCERQIVLGRRGLSRLDERDRAEAPWLVEHAGQVRAESSIGGALRDLAAATGDRDAARRGAHATQRALTHLPARMRPTYLLLTIRLADCWACAGDPGAAVALAAPVAREALATRRATIVGELRGLHTRLGRGWGDLPEVRDFSDRLRALTG